MTLSKVPRLARIRASCILFLLASQASAGLISYTLTFTGTGAISPGQFAFDTGNSRNTTLANVVFPTFTVPIGGIIFTPQSPDDDSVVVNASGFVTALDTDVNPPSTSPLNPEFLQLMPDLSYQLFGPAADIAGQGTYAVKTATSVPEPNLLPPVIGFVTLGAIFYRRDRRYRFSPRDPAR